jgi:uncharacterized protein
VRRVRPLSGAHGRSQEPDFYRAVFRWDTHVISDTPEFRYTTLKSGADDGGWLAGIMDSAGHLSEDVPAHWATYFGVEDTDATLAKVVELGGLILMPAEDTPYGRLAVAGDVTGARFSLVAPNAAMPARR